MSRASLVDVAPVNVIETYEDLIAAGRARRHALGLSQIELDALAGWADGYTAKLEISDRPNQAKNARSIGRASLPLLLGALGARLVLVPEKAIKARAPVPAVESGRRGGQRRVERLSQERLSEIGRAGARARWDRKRADVSRPVPNSEISETSSP